MAGWYQVSLFCTLYEHGACTRFWARELARAGASLRLRNVKSGEKASLSGVKKEKQMGEGHLAEPLALRLDGIKLVCFVSIRAWRMYAVLARELRLLN